MQDVLAKLKEIQENYDNEDIQRAINAAEKIAVAEQEETVEEATDEVVDEEVTEAKMKMKKCPKTGKMIPVTEGDEDDDEDDDEETVEESTDNSDLERMIKLSGRSGVMGMNTNVIVAESVEVVEDEVSEEAFIAKEADEDDEDDEEEVDESFETVEEETVEEDTVEVPVSALQELMKLAGYEEFKIDEYANEPEEDYMSAEYQMDLGGGLNGPKKAYAAAAGGDNPMDQEATEIEEDNKLTFEGMYKRYMNQVVEETLEEKE